MATLEKLLRDEMEYICWMLTGTVKHATSWDPLGNNLKNLF